MATNCHSQNAPPTSTKTPVATNGFHIVKIATSGACRLFPVRSAQTGAWNPTSTNDLAPPLLIQNMILPLCSTTQTSTAPQQWADEEMWFANNRPNWTNRRLG